MSGNAMEEGLMTQIGNPSHLDPSRIGFLAGAVPGFLIVIFLPSFVPRLTGFGAAFIGLVIGLAIALTVTRRLQAKIKAREVLRMIEERKRDATETERQIAEMNEGVNDGR
jgi:membrane associated rhomboid family serine protease